MDDRKHSQLTARLDRAAHRRHLAFSETPPMIGAGLLFLLASLCLLWWFESSPTKPKTIEEEMARQVVPASMKSYQPNLENRVVYLSGAITPGQPLGDAGYLKPQQTLRLERIVEMYQYTGAVTKTPSAPAKPVKQKAVKASQWQKNKAGKPALTQAMAWRPVDRPLPMPKNSKFKNPQPKLRNKVMPANIMLGPLDASRVQIPPTAATALKLTPNALVNRTHFTDGKWLYPAGRKPPKIGDMRISYKVTPVTQKISVVALQKKKALEPYSSSLGSKMIVKIGTVPLNTLLPNTGKSGGDKEDVWLWRTIIAVLMAAGLFISVLPFTEFLALIPIPASMKQVAIGLATTVLAVLMVTILTVITSALQSFWTVGITFILLAAVVLFAHNRRRSQQGKNIRTSMVELPPETQVPDKVS